MNDVARKIVVAVLEGDTVGGAIRQGQEHQSLFLVSSSRVLYGSGEFAEQARQTAVGEAPVDVEGEAGVLRGDAKLRHRLNGGA